MMWEFSVFPSLSVSLVLAAEGGGGSPELWSRGPMAAPSALWVVLESSDLRQNLFHLCHQ